MEVLDNIPLNLDITSLSERLRVEEGSEDGEQFSVLAKELCAVARPKAVYRECYVDKRGEATVTVAGVTFTSSALRANLDGVERVFAFVATCGREVDEIAVPSGDFVQRYRLDALKEAALRCAIRHLNDHLARAYALEKASSMSPGSGDAAVWPIEQQGLLFSLLGDVEALIGVTLTPSSLMVPIKSVSGVRFPKEVDFRSCQLCHRENCPSRGAPLDEILWASMHGEATTEA